MDIITILAIVIPGSLVLGVVGGLLALLLFSPATLREVWEFVKDVFLGKC